jgi:hypothetical protein
LTSSNAGKWAPSGAAESRHVAKRDVIQPLLWLTALTTPICVICSLFAPHDLIFTLICLAGFPPLLVAMAYCWFAVTNSDRLQSEEFRLQQQWFAAQIGDNQTKQVVVLEGRAAEPSPNASLEGDKDSNG